ncbi:ataxin-2 homolog [Drosophila albomicans]|uniref:Ataxin-2 homolog n=1 Tax=Drosophila albomicans TaxID=7291 RepID=A0A6P8YXA3_DROAB|nr:ataxin-2 homolog [Drosophila albomicans]
MEMSATLASNCCNLMLWLLPLLLVLHGSSSWNGASYLDAAQRPLWILEDERNPTEDYETTTRRMRYASQRQDRQLPLRIVVRPDAAPPPLPPRLPHRVQLPSHYVPHHQQQQQRRHKSMFRPRNEQRRRQPQSLPVFDNAPGDNALSATSYPIFVYNGTKGELLVNTMLSAQRYPMQEPVPGQVLYPPSTPMFRPKPLVERFRVPKQRQLLNLTLIPFYAHEAITLAPPPATSTSPSTTTTTTTAATTTTATTLAATPTTAVAVASAAAPEMTTAPTNSVTTPLPRPYETQLPPSKRRRHPKKTKHYNAYRSPQEVVQRPPVLRTSHALAAPNNHRQHHHHHQQTQTSSFDHALLADDELQSEMLDEEQVEEQEQELSEEVPLEENHSSGSSSLQIVYMDDSLEATSSSSTVVPSTVVQRQSSRYSLKREYFAFPVYTLGKLLQDPSSDKVKMGHIVELGDSSEPGGGDTWFILNSRYKGPHRNAQNKSQSNYYTSKYVQNSKGTKT